MRILRRSCRRLLIEQAIHLTQQMELINGLGVDEGLFG